MIIVEVMEAAAKAARPWTNKLGSAVVQDIGQDAVLAAWEASKNGEEIDIVAEVIRRAKREEWHARQDQGTRTVPIDDVSELEFAAFTPTTNDSGEFGNSVSAVPGVKSITPLEMMHEAALAADAHRALLGWLEDASTAKRSGRPVAVPKPLADAVSAELPAVLAWWAHRNRARCASDWQAARAMSPTTEPVRSPAELSDAEVSQYAREGKPKLRPTPIRVHTIDNEADGMAMLSFGPGTVNKPSRRGKREGQATVALGGRRNWSDVGNRAG